MNMCDVMLLSCGIDDDLLETVFSTMLFIEEDNHAQTNDGTDGPENSGNGDSSGV